MWVIARAWRASASAPSATAAARYWRRKWEKRSKAHQRRAASVAPVASTSAATARFRIGLILTALIGDWFRPVATGDRGEPVGRRRQPVPGVAAGRNDRVVVRPDA